uniref:Uncharacterized protein n=1 Tax=Hordeum vulgare subsp. vulgare TaxID=112509 RepID=Q8S3W7_HORVV|nr:hypothetical protein [Hordeum vulgare subsp. vulgare]
MDKDTETKFASAGTEEREGDDPGVPRRGSPLRAAAHTTTHTTSGRRRNPDMAEDARPLWPQLRGGGGEVRAVAQAQIEVSAVAHAEEEIGEKNNLRRGSLC